MKFDLKTFVTIVMTLGLAIFTWNGKIGSELFISTCGAVFAYYFNKDKGVITNDATSKSEDNK